MWMCSEVRWIHADLRCQECGAKWCECAVRGHSHYYVITKGELGFWNVIFALSNAEFDYGRGRGLETDKKWLRNKWTALIRWIEVNRSDSVVRWRVNYLGIAMRNLLILSPGSSIDNWRFVSNNIYIVSNHKCLTPNCIVYRSSKNFKL